MKWLLPHFLMAGSALRTSPFSSSSTLTELPMMAADELATILEADRAARDLACRLLPAFV
jgi:hypothetical protein